MSIYSGFATRNQEQTYDKLIFNLVQILSRKILKNYNQQETDQSKFSQIVKEIFMKLSIMEKQKYLQPNLSNALYDIMEYFIQKEKSENKHSPIKSSNFWIKIQKKSDQNFSNQTQKEPQIDKNQQPSVKSGSIKAISHPQSRLKTPIINPESDDKEKRREIHEKYSIPLKNQRTPISREKQNNKKNLSLRMFQQNYLNETIKNQQSAPKNFQCPHCLGQKISKKSPKPILHRNQRSQSLQKRQKHNIKILVPELVKEYIESTNHLYMKHFRKRKIRNCPEFY